MRKHTPAWAFTGKNDIRHDNKIPGPGAYIINSIWNKNRASMPKSKRPEIYKITNYGPGPGSYTFDYSPTTSNSMGKSKRMPSISDGIPGPGSYNVSPRKTSPGISMKPKLSLNHFTCSPGPGAYNS